MTAAELDARMVVRRGGFVLDATVHADPGEVVALLGPNGAGKSTLLAVLAGLILPERGAVRVAGQVLTRCGLRDEGPAIAIPPERRGVGLLGQEALLFPHLTAERNVAFGLTSQGVPTAEALQDAREWLAAIGLPDVAARRPAALSGGQQQRVAIARALAARPRVLLLDEPMAALDVQTAVSIRQLLHDQLSARGTTTVLVTHDVVDALVLADRVAILHAGRIVDEGPTARVLGDPKTTFIAALAGVNRVVGTVDEAGCVRAGDRRFAGRGVSGLPAGSPASVVFRPAAVRIGTDADVVDGISGEANRWIATISVLEPSASGVRVRFADDDVVAECAPAEAVALEPGRRVRLSVDAADVTVNPRS